MQEQRLTARLLKYWDLVRKTARIPEIGHFNTEPIRDLWTECFLVAVNPNGDNGYRYDYIGPSITKIHGRDLTGTAVDPNTKKFPGVIMFKKLVEVAAEQCPKEESGHFLSEGGKLVKYRACFLPFGNDKKGLTHIAVGLSCRLF